jgi:hypothetical protein
MEKVEGSTQGTSQPRPSHGCERPFPAHASLDEHLPLGLAMLRNRSEPLIAKS